jgi:hypothetical protein
MYLNICFYLKSYKIHIFYQIQAHPSAKSQVPPPPLQLGPHTILLRSRSNFRMVRTS